MSEAPILGKGLGKCVENGGVFPAGKLLRSISQCKSLGAIADRGVWAGCQKTCGKIQREEAIGFFLQRQMQLGERIGEPSLQIKYVTKILVPL